MKPIAYQDQVQRCAAEIQDLLPPVSRRYPPLILIAALTEHVGSVLFLSQQARLCSPELARTIVERVKQLAFAP